jgi:phage baseplate assembly protein W
MNTIVIGNSPFRNGVSPETWNKVNVTHFTTGGTLSRDPLYFVSASFLEEVATTGLKEVYSSCLARDPDTEANEVLRHQSFGVDIPFIRFGNEEGNYSPSASLVTIDTAYVTGSIAAQQYVAEMQPRREAFEDIGDYTYIYCGVFVSDQVGTRLNEFRRGWNDGLTSSINPNDIIDLHVYKRLDRKPPAFPDSVSMDYFFDEVHGWANRVCIIESGVTVDTIPTSSFGVPTAEGRAEFLSKTEITWNNVKNSLRSTDIMGVQLIEDVTNPVGLLFEGEITAVGEIFQRLFPRYSEGRSELGRDYFSYFFPTQTADKIKINLINYLLTDKKERIFNPNFGANLRALLFENIEDNTLDNLQERIQNDIRRFFPMVNIREVQFEKLTDNNTVNFSLTYDIPTLDVLDTLNISLQ